METEIVQTKSKTPSELIEFALLNKGDLEKLEKLLELQERYEANEARKVFAKDFAIAQANIIPVIKTKINPQTRSKYADLADVVETTQPVYTKQGFSVTFNEGDSPKEGYARILADVLHSMGHKEQYHLDVPLDGTGIKGNANMTAIHGKASSMQYGRRYLMCMIWNIPTADADGNSVAIEFITDKQLHQLRDLLLAKELPEGKLCAYLGVETLEKLPSDKFVKALTAINEASKKVSK